MWKKNLLPVAGYSYLPDFIATGISWRSFGLLLYTVLLCTITNAQMKINTTGFESKNGASVLHKNNQLVIGWPVGAAQKGQVIINLEIDKPLFSSIGIGEGATAKSIIKQADPAFLLTVGKRDLVSQNGWNIFFDKVPLKPHQSYVLTLQKKSVSVKSSGSRTIIKVDELAVAGFMGAIEITLYNGSPLLNIAAVIATVRDSVAIVYDAGLVSKEKIADSIHWVDVNNNMQGVVSGTTDSSIHQRVKYRTVLGSNVNGTAAIFPAPHQYFYPLDEAFNLAFTWYGNQYSRLLDGYGFGIRQDLYGDNRYVPWFNAPPNTQQRLSFFCYIGTGDAATVINKVKAFTHNDSYMPLKGYKTMASHFHNEYVMKEMLSGKPFPDTPGFIKVFAATGIDIVHLAEFHYTAHPKGPAEQRLNELKALFTMCGHFSNHKFLLLPGEEPNEFFGGHWLQLFPKPVYWIMARKEQQPFISSDTTYGKVYRIGNAAEMLALLKKEKGLAWTAHPRTKGSTGFPDKYRDEAFFKSDRFLGAAWKAMPADLSRPRLGARVLDLMNDMNNWGYKKNILAEADLFTIEPQNEMYAHLNVNYLRLKELPRYKNGWQPVLDALQTGQFFSTTGEVLIPLFTVNGISAGQTTVVTKKARAMVSFNIAWTFPLSFAEIISGDGVNVYRSKIDLGNTRAFGRKTFQLPVNLYGRKWVRLEVWDVAANGAFTQTVWLQ
jgi:hypothetical protein